MKNKFLFTVIITSICLLIFVIKTFAQDEIKKESFKVNKGGTLKVDISSGDIKVKTGNDSEVKISYEDDEDYNNVTTYQDGNNITIRSDDNVDFEISVPSEFNLNLNTSGGDIDLMSNLKGNVKINTSGGDISTKEVTGELSANTSGGDINCGNVKGSLKLGSSGGDIMVGSVEGECEVSTGGGNVIVKNVTKSLSVSTGGGNVNCGNIGSDVKVVTGGGNISVDNISGVMNVKTGGGDIYGVSINKGGTVVTGAGNISLNNLSGDVKITSGAGDVTAQFISVGSNDSKIVSGYGNVKVFIPENAKVTIEATVKLSEGNVYSVDKQSLSESIKSDFKSTTEDKRKGEYHAVYIINGGGTNIFLQTSIGDIEIRKLKR